ncbi:MAG: hypothetical protein KDK05_27815, partial [Candidatus Competibacteraceae bacterium]|nr:hypothetical protein [Candidatus Competibacteraceae bacterium]
LLQVQTLGKVLFYLPERVYLAAEPAPSVAPALNGFIAVNIALLQVFDGCPGSWERLWTRLAGDNRHMPAESASW